MLRRAVSSMRPGSFYDLIVSACSVPSLLMSHSIDLLCYRHHAIRPQQRLFWPKGSAAA